MARRMNSLSVSLGKLVAPQPDKPKAKQALDLMVSTRKPTAAIPSKAKTKQAKGNDAAKAERSNAKSQAGMGRKGSSFAKAKARLNAQAPQA